ncbi:NfeD family protein [Caldiplasma sukawensis]
MISNTLYYLSLILFAIVFFFFGAWFYRLYLWYPRGRKGVTGINSLIGKTGTIVSDNGTMLSVRVDGQYWTAIRPSDENIKVGDTVVVKGVRGLRLIIEVVTNGN